MHRIRLFKSPHFTFTFSQQNISLKYKQTNLFIENMRKYIVELDVLLFMNINKPVRSKNVSNIPTPPPPRFSGGFLKETLFQSISQALYVFYNENYFVKPPSSREKGLEPSKAEKNGRTPSHLLCEKWLDLRMELQMVLYTFMTRNRPIYESIKFVMYNVLYYRTQSLERSARSQPTLSVGISGMT